mgnify:CR=1 FL=1
MGLDKCPVSYYYCSNSYKGSEEEEYVAETFSERAVRRL